MARQYLQVDLTRDEIEIALTIFRDHLHRLLESLKDASTELEKSDYRGFILHTMGLIRVFTEQGGDPIHLEIALEDCADFGFNVNNCEE